MQTGLMSLSFNSFKGETVSVAFKDPVRTAQKTLFALVIKTSQLMLYREIIALCSEIHIKHKYTVWAERRIIYKDPVHTAQ